MNRTIRSKRLNDLFAKKLGKDAVLASRLKVGFAGDVWKILSENGMTGRQLAEKLGVSEAYVSKALKGDANLTIDTIAKIACAINAEMSLVIRPEQARVKKVTTSNVFDLAMKNASAGNTRDRRAIGFSLDNGGHTQTFRVRGNGKLKQGNLQDAA